MRKDMTGPSILFERPMCAEVMGAGFQRIPDSSVGDKVVSVLTTALRVALASTAKNT